MRANGLLRAIGAGAFAVVSVLLGMSLEKCQMSEREIVVALATWLLVAVSCYWLAVRLELSETNRNKWKLSVQTFERHLGVYWGVLHETFPELQTKEFSDCVALGTRCRWPIDLGGQPVSRWYEQVGRDWLSDADATALRLARTIYSEDRNCERGTRFNDARHELTIEIGNWVEWHRERGFISYMTGPVRRNASALRLLAYMEIACGECLKIPENPLQWTTFGEQWSL